MPFGGGFSSNFGAVTGSSSGGETATVVSAPSTISSTSTHTLAGPGRVKVVSVVAAADSKGANGQFQVRLPPEGIGSTRRFAVHRHLGDESLPPADNQRLVQPR